MEWWQELAASRGGDAAWEDALAAWALSPVDPSHQRILAEACERPSQIVLLQDLLRLTPRETESAQDRARLFLEIVDESEASLLAWISSLEIFFDYLRKQGRNTSFGLALGYLQCCSDALGGNGLKYTGLPHAVEDMLEAYGFDG